MPPGCTSWRVSALAPAREPSAPAAKGGFHASSADNCQFESLRILNNGEKGIWAGSNSTLSGLNCLSNAYRIMTDEGCLIQNNVCAFNGGMGIDADGRSTVANNVCRSNAGDGIRVHYDCFVRDNNCSENGLDFLSAGIYVMEQGNAIEHNLLTNNDYGVYCYPGGNYIASNRAHNNPTNYDIGPGNTEGSGDLANVEF